MGCGGSKAKAQGQEAPAPNLLQGSAPTGDVKVCPEGDYKVTLERSSDADTLGMSIAGNADSNSYKIQALKEEGIAPAYNKTQENAPEQQIKAGDLIVAVNAVFGDLDAMKKQLSEKAVTLTLKRAAPEPEAAAATSAPATASTEEAAAEPAAEAAAEPAAEPPAEAAAAPAEEPSTEQAPATDVAAVEPVAAEQVASGAPDAAPAEVAASTEAEAAPEAAVVTIEPSPPADDEECLPIAEEPLEVNPEGGKCMVCGC